MIQYTLSFLLESLVMSVIILVFLSFNALFLKIFSAKLRYMVWMMLLAGLLIPMNKVIDSGFITVTLSVEPQAQYVASEVLPNKSPVQTYSAQELATVNIVKNTSSVWIVLPFMICVLVWGVVAVVIFTCQIRRYFRFVGIIRRWGEPVKDETALAIFRSIQEKKGLGHKKIELVICEFVPSTLLTGFLRPMVVLPKKHFEADELELIFRHELVHYKRRDLFVKLMSVIAVSIHWFNPVVHWMNAVMHADGEACCDEAVLSDIGDENRQFYAELMIKMTGNRNTTGTMLSTCFYGGKKSVKRRLDAILNTSDKMKRPACIAFIAFAALAILSGSVFTFTVQGDIRPFESLETKKDIESINLEQIREIAITAVDGGIVGRIETRYNIDGRIEYYSFIIVYGDNKYEVNVDAYDGTVKNIKMEKVTTIDANISDTTGIIGADKVKSIAIESAGGGVVIMCRLENRPLIGTLVYHVHVAQNAHWEYCVEIDASTGAVIVIEQRYKP
jgi:beta-lactamase regulating signal transducer with metallopeptidase domain